MSTATAISNTRVRADSARARGSGCHGTLHMCVDLDRIRRCGTTSYLASQGPPHMLSVSGIARMWRVSASAVH